AAAGRGRGRADPRPAGGTGEAGFGSGGARLAGFRGRRGARQPVRRAGNAEEENLNHRVSRAVMALPSSRNNRIVSGAIPWLCRSPASPRPVVACVVPTTRSRPSSWLPTRPRAKPTCATTSPPTEQTLLRHFVTAAAY